MSISREEFVMAFRSAWKTLQEGSVQEVLDAYNDHSRWTDFVLGADVGLARRTMVLLESSYGKMDYVREWLRVDAMYVSPDTIWGADPEAHFYPTKLLVLIENENGGEWDTELWRLAHLKAGLKVLIGYNFNGQSFTDWISGNGKDSGESALKKINRIDPSDADRFLLIVGSRDQSSGLPGFRYLGPDGNELQLQTAGS